MDYSRRNFIKQNSLTGLGILAMGGIGGCTERKSQAENANSSDVHIKTIGDMPLEELREKYRTELFSRFLPNMDSYAVDHEHGGVMCSLDVRTGELENTNKTAWFVGRGLWLYSYLYNNLEKDPRFLEIASKSKDLLLSLQPSDDSFWVSKFTREGSPLSGPGDIYGSLFVAEGLAEYAKASGEMKYRELAKKIIFNCVGRYDQPDYSYNISYLQNAPEIQGPRVLGHWMIFLSLSTQMLKHAPDKDLEKLAERSVNAIMKHHINPEHGLTNEVINHDLSVPDNEYAQFSVIGHGLETLAFVMFEAARIKDKELFELSQNAFKKHVNVAHDALYGGYFHNLLDVNKYDWEVRKSLWNQQEVLNGALFLIEHTGDDWARRTFAGTDAYIFEKFFRPENKFWFSGGDRKLSDPNTDLLEHYHHGRQLMYGLLSIERMIKREGKVSGLFG
jgi:N-acylglucosamine 2-epimerase